MPQLPSHIQTEKRVIFELDGAEETADPIDIYAPFKLAVGVSPAAGLVDLSPRASNEIQMVLPSLLVVFPSGSDQACP